MSAELIAALIQAVAAVPADTPLRLRLAELLLEAGRHVEAIEHASVVLREDPDHGAARAIVAAAVSAPGVTAEGVQETGFDFALAEAELRDIVGPTFVAAHDHTLGHDADVDVERSTLTLADVGGMQRVKDRLNGAFLAPLRNPDLRRLYAKSLSGRLLMYGPPGCGKTFLARAVAGELGASFISVGLADVLNPAFGISEQRAHQFFELARREAPCVLFFDEIDALGQRRSQAANTGMRGVVNQMLTELDGIDSGDDGVFVLAATNQPWDLDPAFRRPGRFDRTVVVLPPDPPARGAIFRYHLGRRPVENIDIDTLVRRSEGFSGADIAYVCELAAEAALLDSANSGTVRLIGQKDLLAALSHVPPSTSSWLASARNLVTFGEDDGTFAELRAYLKAVRRL